jgi:glycosyltransferase involved in cell wall biosynthesis
MNVTVIIPTYNRADILAKTLEAYAAQLGEHRICEILVVDDGSTDHTRSAVEKASESCRRTRYLRQSNLGLAAARNHGIREAAGDVLLFGDDDIIPSPRLAAEHVAWQDRYPEGNCGVLGHVDWWPDVRPTPFMKWEGLYGPQFNYGCFEHGQELSYEFGYCCNWSVHASFLRDSGIFSERFRTYGYEDIELAYRLSKKGYRHFYNRDAIGYHNKFETCADALRRIDKLYRSWPEFAKTEAGRDFLEKWRSTKSRSKRGLSRRMLAPLKPFAVRLLRPLMDTRIPLPRWSYEQVFYHYVTSFADIVEEQGNVAKA